MDSSERKFINIIGKYAFGEKQLEIYNNINYNNFNWTNLLRLSNIHDVDSIVHSSLIKDNFISNYNSVKINNLIKRSSSSQAEAKKNLDNFILIIDKLKSEGIPFISLKGLIEKTLYPSSENRITKEFEILTHNKDLNLIREILFNYGYSFKYNNDGNYLKFDHKKYSPIIIRSSFFTLSNNVQMINKLEKDIWTNSIEKKLNNITILSPCDEDMLLYLTISMACKLKDSNITIMDICDFSLLYSKLQNSINWDSFFIKASICEIETFLLAIFIVSNEFFNTTIPKEYNIKKIYNQRYINTLINNILYANSCKIVKDEKNTSKFKLKLKNIFKKNRDSVTYTQISNWLNLN